VTRPRAAVLPQREPRWQARIERGYRDNHVFAAHSHLECPIAAPSAPVAIPTRNEVGLGASGKARLSSVLAQKVKRKVTPCTRLSSRLGLQDGVGCGWGRSSGARLNNNLVDRYFLLALTRALWVNHPRLYHSPAGAPCRGVEIQISFQSWLPPGSSPVCSWRRLLRLSYSVSSATIARAGVALRRLAVLTMTQARGGN
jgi:hypothetical protein